MEENSKKMKSGLEKAPHRSLLYALGLTREEMERPLVGVVNAASEVVPGHLHLGKLAEAVKAGVRMAGGTPLEFPAIAVCDGIAMNHEGMRFSLPSREFIADSIEIMARPGLHPQLRQVRARHAHGHDAPEHPLGAGLRRPHAARHPDPRQAGRPHHPVRGRGPRAQRPDDRRRTDPVGRTRLPRLWFLCGHVHGQLHELPGRDHRRGPARQRHHPGRACGPCASGQAGRHARHGSGEAQHPSPRHRDPRRRGKCHRRGHGPGLLHQHHPAPARHLP